MPVSLTSVAEKVIEQIMRAITQNIQEKKQVIRPSWYGFKKVKWYRF